METIPYFSRGAQGMTLVEIIITLAVLGVLLAVAIPNFSGWMDKYRMDAEAQKVYYDLLLAKSTAIKNNNDVIVTFNTSDNTYTIHDDTDSDGVQDSGETVKTVELEDLAEFNFNGPLLDTDGNSVSSAISLGGSSVTFDSKGQASTSGSVFLIPTGDVGVQNDRMRSVSIIQATGAVDLWRYDADGTPGPWS